jgi:hypothetical protein
MTESAYVDLQLKWTEWDIDEISSLDLDSLQFIAGIKVQF